MELSLRQLKHDELQALARGEHPASLPPLIAPSTLPPAKVIARAVARIAEGQPEVWWLPLLMVRAADGIVVGGCGFKGPPVAGRAEIFYGVARECRRLGVAGAALERMVAMGQALGADALLAEIEPGNLASARTVQRCGFTVVGRRVAEDGVEVVQWLRPAREGGPSVHGAADAGGALSHGATAGADPEANGGSITGGTALAKGTGTMHWRR